MGDFIVSCSVTRAKCAGRIGHVDPCAHQNCRNTSNNTKSRSSSLSRSDACDCQNASNSIKSNGNSLSRSGSDACDCKNTSNNLNSNGNSLSMSGSDCCDTRDKKHECDLFGCSSWRLGGSCRAVGKGDLERLRDQVRRRVTPRPRSMWNAIESWQAHLDQTVDGDVIDDNLIHQRVVSKCVGTNTSNNDSDDEDDIINYRINGRAASVIENIHCKKRLCRCKLDSSSHLHVDTEDRIHVGTEDRIHMGTKDRIHLDTKDIIHVDPEDRIHVGTKDIIHVDPEDRIHVGTKDSIHMGTEDRMPVSIESSCLPGVGCEVVEKSVEDIIQCVERMTRSAWDVADVTYSQGHVSSPSSNDHVIQQQQSLIDTTTCLGRDSNQRVDTKSSAAQDQTTKCRCVQRTYQQEIPRTSNSIESSGEKDLVTKLEIKAAGLTELISCELDNGNSIDMCNSITSGPSIEDGHREYPFLVSRVVSNDVEDICCDDEMKPRLNSFGEDRGISSDFGSSLEFLDSSTSEIGYNAELECGRLGRKKVVSDDSDLGSSKDDLNYDSSSDDLDLSEGFLAGKCMTCDDSGGGGGGSVRDCGLSSRLPYTQSAKDGVGKCRLCVDFNTDEGTFSISSDTYSPPLLFVGSAAAPFPVDSSPTLNPSSALTLNKVTPTVMSHHDVPSSNEENGFGDTGSISICETVPAFHSYLNGSVCRRSSKENVFSYSTSVLSESPAGVIIKSNDSPNIDEEFSKTSTCLGFHSDTKDSIGRTAYQEETFDPHYVASSLSNTPTASDDSISGHVSSQETLSLREKEKQSSDLPVDDSIENNLFSGGVIPLDTNLELAITMKSETGEYGDCNTENDGGTKIRDTMDEIKSGNDITGSKQCIPEEAFLREPVVTSSIQNVQTNGQDVPSEDSSTENDQGSLESLVIIEECPSADQGDNKKTKKCPKVDINPFFASIDNLDLPLTSLENHFPSFFARTRSIQEQCCVEPASPCPSVMSSSDLSLTPDTLSETTSSIGSKRSRAISKRYSSCLKTVTSALRRIPSPSKVLQRSSSLFGSHKCVYDLQLASMAYFSSCPSTPVTGKRKLTATPSLLTFTSTPGSQSLPPSPSTHFARSSSSLHLPPSTQTCSVHTTPVSETLRRDNEDTVDSSSSLLSSLSSSTLSISTHTGVPLSSMSSASILLSPTSSPSSTLTKKTASFWPSKSSSKFRKLRYRSLSLDSRMSSSSAAGVPCPCKRTMGWGREDSLVPVPCMDCPADIVCPHHHHQPFLMQL